MSSVLIGTAAMMVFYVHLADAEATPLRAGDIPVTVPHITRPAAPPETGDQTLLDSLPFPTGGSTMPNDPGLTGGDLSQQDLPGRLPAPQAPLNRDAFSGLTSIGITDGGDAMRLQKLRDILPSGRDVPKEWFFDSAPASANLRHGDNATGLPGVSDLIFDNPLSTSVIRNVTDIKAVTAHAIDFSVLGMGDFTLERLPDNRGVVIREGTTGVELGLHHSTLADSDPANASAHNDESGGQVLEETNLTRIVFAWIEDRLTSPLGILCLMFIAVVLLLWGVANSIVMFRRRARSQSNA